MESVNHHRKDFDTLVEALQDLNNRGYSGNLKLRDDFLEESERKLMLYPSNFTVVESYRFEGPSDPGDNTVVYAIESNDGDFKGVLVSGYGAYFDSASAELIKKLEITHYH
jgi:hypothetical protein